jgi:hypothetical protein
MMEMPEIVANRAEENCQKRSKEESRTTAQMPMIELKLEGGEFKDTSKIGIFTATSWVQLCP